MDGNDGTYEPLPLPKYIPLVVLQVITSFASMVTSIVILRIASPKLQSTYQRYLYSLSIAVILNALFLLLHHFLVPSESSGADWASGNDATCTTVGFFLVFGSLMASLYSNMLALYFYFSIQTNDGTKQRPHEDVIGWPERLAHCFCWMVPAALGGAGVGLEGYQYDPALNMCTLTSSGSNNSVEILRHVFQWALVGSAAVSIVVTLIIQWQVRGTLKKMQAMTEREDQDLDPDTDEQQLQLGQKLAAVSTQCLLYTLAYLASFVWFVVLVFLPTNMSNLLYAFQVITATLYPLQGVFNCIIYVRPRVQMLNIMYPQDPHLVILRVAMSKAGDPEEIERIRAELYGSEYSGSEAIRGGSEIGSIGSDIPSVVHFEEGKPISIKSLVSIPGDQDNKSTVSPIGDPEEIDESHEIASR